MTAPLTPPICLTTFLVGAVTAIAGFVWLFRRQRGIPPGPPVYLPGLGHLLRFARGPIQELHALRQQYGDVFAMYLGTKLVVVINGYDVISEVLRARGSEFSHRPPLFLSEKMAEFKGLLNTSGTVWSEQKNNVMRTLRSLTSNGGHFDLYLQEETDRLFNQLKTLTDKGMEKSVGIAPYIKKAVCSLSFTLVYGRVLEYESRELTMYCDILDELFRHVGLLATLNFVPCAHLLPGDPVRYHRCLQLVKDLEREVVRPEITSIQKMIGGPDDNSNILEPGTDLGYGHVTESLVSGYLREMLDKNTKGAHTEMSETQLTRTAGDLMAGSYDTVSNTLLWLLLYLVHHPQVQNRCRDEVDRALEKCGGNKGSVDRSDLVYTQATIMEVQRLANVAPLPPAHCCDHDITIRGYTIPKNTIIMVNMDSLMMGAEVGEDAQVFRPDRFIDDQGMLVQPKWFLPYATGTRMCIGASIAKRELLPFTVTLLHNFIFQAPVVDGRACMPGLEGELGLTRVPKPFTVCLRARV